MRKPPRGAGGSPHSRLLAKLRAAVVPPVHLAGGDQGPLVEFLRGHRAPHRLAELGDEFLVVDARLGEEQPVNGFDLFGFRVNRNLMFATIGGNEHMILRGLCHDTTYLSYLILS